MHFTRELKLTRIKAELEEKSRTNFQLLKCSNHVEKLRIKWDEIKITQVTPEKRSKVY